MGKAKNMTKDSTSLGRPQPAIPAAVLRCTYNPRSYNESGDLGVHTSRYMTWPYNWLP
jgi:hypothetical protein